MRAGIEARIRKLEERFRPGPLEIRDGLALYLETGHLPGDERLKTIVLKIASFMEACDAKYKTE